MPSRLSLQRLALLMLVSLVILGPGCGAEPDSPAASALRRSFPEQAEALLDGEPRFVPTAEGFALRPAEAPGLATTSAGGLRAELPRHAENPLRIEAKSSLGSFTVKVRERGARGEITAAGSALSHTRPEGTSFWAAVPGGLEEWLLLDAGVAHAGEVVARWDIEGGALRQQGEAVEIADEAGIPRIRVTAPAAWAPGGRAVHATLAVRGEAIELSVDAGGEPVLVDPLWVATASMVAPRASFGSVVLQSGKVMAIGGANGAVYHKTVEIYDPATATWAAAAPMSAPRASFTTTLLANGKVLVAGGFDGSKILGAAELYDPATNVWAGAGAMISPRRTHAAALLATSKVLTVGGESSVGTLASADLYDPATNTWAATGALAAARRLHTATVLGNGKVLVTGGNGAAATSLATTELYTAATGTWAAGGSMNGAREDHSATLLANGKVLAAAGNNWFTPVNGQILKTTELYDPVANTWAGAAVMGQFRQAHTATLLANGAVLITGGSPLTASVEFYDPTGNTWTAAGALITARASHQAVPLPAGRALIFGGQGAASALATAEIYGPGANGTPCALPGECLSGICADAVCCNAICNGLCQACTAAKKGAGADGTCGSIIVGQDPDNECAMQAAATCGTTGACSGAGACQLYANGTACNDANACTQTDTCQNGACTGNNPVICPAPDQCHNAGVCNAATGVCSNPNKADGTACNDGNACTQTDTCQAGVCTGANPVVCPAPDQCHNAGVCNAATGVCSNPAKVNGTACNDGSACTQTDTCQAGVCTGANAVICPAPDQCHNAGVCNAATGVCSNPSKANGTACNDGNGCTQTDTCQAGVCTGANPVVCAALDQCHTAGVCAAATGLCSNPLKANGTACNDGSACTQTDTCQAGACTGANPVVCPAPDQCHNAGVCNAATGVCSNPNKANNTACNDGNGCTQTDTCQAGVCTGANPVVCGAATQCTNGGVCNPATGVCSGAPKPDGTACSDGNACTQTDTCAGGACVGANAVVCAMPDQCHDPGACNPATGVCSNPNKANGAACNDGNACTQTDTCQAGACSGANPVVCAALDQCHSAGVCAQATGMCSNPLKADGVACNDGNACTQTDTCLAGACTGNTPVNCAPLDACHVAGTCDAATGACSNPVAADGGACDDGNPCTTNDTCQAGACGGSALACAPLDACHDAGVCDPTTGACSDPPKEAGASCDDGDACTMGDSCQAGACVPGAATDCIASDGCHDPGVCNPATGVCSDPPKAIDCSAQAPCENDGVCDPGTGACQKSSKPDGTPCPGGVCVAGGCVLDPVGSGAGGGAGTGTGSGAGAGTGGGASGTTGATGSGAGSGSSGTTGGSSGDGGTSGGCGCAVVGEPARASWALLLGALALLRRRRARAMVGAPTKMV